MVDEANSLASEAIQNIRTIASFTAEEHTVNRYNATLELPLRAGLKVFILRLRQDVSYNVKRAKILGLIIATGELFLFVGYTISFYYGGKLIANGEMGFKSVMTVFQAILMTTLTLGNSVSFAPNIGGAKLAAARLFKIADEPSKIDPFSTEGKKEEINGIIEFKDIHFRYTTRKVIDYLRVIL